MLKEKIKIYVIFDEKTGGFILEKPNMYDDNRLVFFSRKACNKMLGILASNLLYETHKLTIKEITITKDNADIDDVGGTV